MEWQQWNETKSFSSRRRSKEEEVQEKEFFLATEYEPDLLAGRGGGEGRWGSNSGRRRQFKEER